jgi:Fe-S cluster assembly protein SufD
VSAVLLEEFGIGDERERAESWRYSRAALRALEQQTYAIAHVDSELTQDLIARFDWVHTRGKRAVFVNGGFSQRYSSLADSKVTIDHRDAVSTIRFAEPETLHVVFANIGGNAASRWRREILIDVASTGATLIEHHIGDAVHEVLGSLQSTIQLSPSAQLTLTTLSDLPDSMSLYRRERVCIGMDATYRSTHALFGGRFQRFDLDVELSERAYYHARGVFALRGRQHVDVHLNARHAARDTRCDISWRGVADQRSRGILHGAITVAEGADGADAQLQTKNILLSPHAEIDAQPVLEIYADEVKAAHGATVGQLDETALFYLRSRGIATADARSMMIAGFCREAFSDLSDSDLRERIDAVLVDRLPHARETAK